MHNTGSDGRPFECQPDNIAGCGLWKPEDVLAQLSLERFLFYIDVVIGQAGSTYLKYSKRHACAL